MPQRNFIKMKKIIILCIGCISWVFAGCKNSNTPDQTAIKFLNCMYTYDFEGAKNLSTSNTWPIINGIKKATAEVSEEEKLAMVGKLKVEILNVKQETDSTELVYYNTQPDFQIFKAIKILKQVDEDGKIRYKVDNASTDSLSGGDDLQLDEVIHPFEDETASDTSSHSS